MVQKPIFKVFIWFMVNFFFFIVSAIAISIFGPGPSESSIMKFQAGMMQAMDTSFMGVSMSIEHNNYLQEIILKTLYMFIPLIILGVILGLAIRLNHREEKGVRKEA